MSTGWGYACITHDPPLLGGADLNHGFDALVDALTKVRTGTWPQVSNHFGGFEDDSLVVRPGGEGHLWPIRFLRQHPRCRIAIYNEYGDTWFTDDGLIRVSGPDERTHWKRPPGVVGQAKVNLIPGVYPPEGEMRCTCVTPTLAVTHPEFSTRGGWVRCTTCGGTSLPSEREVRTE